MGAGVISKEGAVAQSTAPGCGRGSTLWCSMHPELLHAFILGLEMSEMLVCYLCSSHQWRWRHPLVCLPSKQNPTQSQAAVQGTTHSKCPPFFVVLPFGCLPCMPKNRRACRWLDPNAILLVVLWASVSWGSPICPKERWWRYCLVTPALCSALTFVQKKEKAWTLCI